jgi:hypothetical protein
VSIIVKSDYAFLLLSVSGLFSGLGFGWFGLGAGSGDLPGEVVKLENKAAINFRAA